MTSIYLLEIGVFESIFTSPAQGSSLNSVGKKHSSASVRLVVGKTLCHFHHGLGMVYIYHL